MSRSDDTVQITGTTTREHAVVVSVAGRIDAANAQDFEDAVIKRIAGCRKQSLVLDLHDLVYVSSAGLRAFMRLARGFEHFSMEEVQSDVYDVLEMTGFTEMFETKRVLREISVEGCAVIGRGNKGAVYRLDPETIVKVVYATGDDALTGIARERELARAAFVAGIPTAISYDVVRVGEHYGAVYELLDAKTLAELVSSGEAAVAQAAGELGGLMAQMHETPARPDLMPSAREAQLDELDTLDGHMDAGLYRRVRGLVEALPEDATLIHGDLHAGNVMLQGGEALLIDMDTLSRGAAALELGPVYNAYVGFGELDHSISEQFMGFAYEVGVALWEGVVARYSEGRSLDPRRVALVGEFMGRLRQLRRIVAHGDEATPHGIAVTERCAARIQEMLLELDSLELTPMSY